MSSAGTRVGVNYATMAAVPHMVSVGCLSRKCLLCSWRLVSTSPTCSLEVAATFSAAQREDAISWPHPAERSCTDLFDWAQQHSVKDTVRSFSRELERMGFDFH